MSTPDSFVADEHSLEQLRTEYKNLSELLELVPELSGPLHNRCEELLSSTKHRLALGDGVVSCFIGPTGAGKSSLFNAIFDEEITEAGFLRPTTTSAVAAIPTVASAGALLDWLGVGRRVVVKNPLAPNIVVVDLPDIDSCDEANREIARKFAKRTDLLIWVVDPQKYADSSVHDGFIQSMSKHADLTLVVLSQIDTVPKELQGQLLKDVERVFKQSGLENISVTASSTVTKEGVREIRKKILALANERAVSRRRLLADFAALREELSKELLVPYQQIATGSLEVNENCTARVDQALWRAAKGTQLLDAVQKSYERRGALATRWPLLRMIDRFRADPLASLHLKNADPSSATTLGGPEAGSLAVLENTLAVVTQESSAQLPRKWQREVGKLATVNTTDIADRMDKARHSIDLGTRPYPLWWKAVDVVQIFAFIAAVIGLIWLVGAHLINNLLLVTYTPPKIGMVPWAALILIAALLTGLCLGGLASVFVKASGRRIRMRVENELKTQLHTEVTAALLAPLYAKFEEFKKIVRCLGQQ